MQALIEHLSSKAGETPSVFEWVMLGIVLAAFAALVGMMKEAAHDYDYDDWGV